MNLSTATPAQIDTAIADLERQAWEQAATIASAVTVLHHAVGDRRTRSGWRMTDPEVLDAVRARLASDPGSARSRFLSVSEDDVNRRMTAIAAAKAEGARLNDEIERHETEYRRRPWTRFFQLRSTNNAHIHSSRDCPSLHRSSLGDLGWHPELSGKSEEEAVAKLGPVMCSKCFRSAPVEWRQNPADLKPADPNACDGGEDGGKDPVEGTIKRHKNYSGVRYYGECPDCHEVKLLKSGNKLPKHRKPKSKKK